MFRGEKLLYLSPDDAISSEADLRSLSGPEFGIGDKISIGELQFSLAHSARTVALPEVYSQDGQAGALERGSATGASAGARPRAILRALPAVYSDAEVKRLGVVGQAKRCLCPKCSGLLSWSRNPRSLR